MESTINSNNMDSAIQLPRTPFLRKLCYGVGHVLNDLCASMWFSYLLVYFHSVAEFSNQMAGYVMLIGQVADGVCTPFIGYESDRTKGLCGYGKRKSWHLVGTLSVLCSFPFIFSQCIECSHAVDWARLIYYAPFVVIFQFGWAATQISHLSLIPDITPYEDERVELNAIRYSFTVISNVIVYVLTWFLIETHSQSSMTDTITPKDSTKFMELSFIVIGIGAVFSLVFHAGTKEDSSMDDLRVDHRLQTCTGSRLKRNRVVWSDWLSNQQFYLIAVLYMGTRLTVNMSQVYLPIFLTDTLSLDKSYIAIIPLVVYLSSFVASVVMKPVNRLLGRKGTYFLGTLFIFGACIWMWFIATDTCTRKEIFGAAVLLGIGCSTLLITSLSMTADLIADNTESGAFVFGAMSLCDKLSNGLGVMLVQQLHPCSPRTGQCCDKCSWYYQYIIVFVTAGASVMALVALLFLLPQKIGERNLVHQDLLIEDGSEDRDCTVPILSDEPLCDGGIDGALNVQVRSAGSSPVRRYGSVNSPSLLESLDEGVNAYKT